MKKVVVIGGGHGQSIILQGLKEIDNIDIKTIVTVADSGGSTGRIREIYDIPAMGDIRNVLVALSNNKQLRELMDYRFEGDVEEDVIGHNLGNLILTAFTNITGSFTEAIKDVSQYMDIKGEIIPVSLEPLTLYATMEDDTIVKGEKYIPSTVNHIKKIYYDHEVVAYKKAIEAIKEADLIIYGIGSLYTSIIPNTIIPEIKEALKETKALRVYFANSMTQGNETFGYNLKNHIDALIEHGAIIDLVVKHNDTIPENIKQKYLTQNAIEVINEPKINIKTIEANLLDFTKGYAKHDPQKIKKEVEELLKEL